MAPKGLKIRPPFLLLLFLSLFSTPQRTEALVGIGQWRVIASLSHSLMNRVANVRAERGDLEGANRARKIASKMEGGLGLGLGFWSVGWDYAKNYAWRSRDVESSNEILRAVSDANELLGLLKELGGVESEKERAKWVYQNYQRVLDASKSILRRLLVVFARSGPLREIVLIVQKEADGDLLRDCLEVGVNDLKGLLKVAKDIGLNFLSSPSRSSHPSDEL
ncbi:hypothetical protein AAC387_Pa12g2134 [Persea americana]